VQRRGERGREEEECQGGRSQNAQWVAIDGASVRAACLPRGRSWLLRDLVFGFLIFVSWGRGSFGRGV
jgi:hypothetical protein